MIINKLSAYEEQELETILFELFISQETKKNLTEFDKSAILYSRHLSLLGYSIDLTSQYPNNLGIRNTKFDGFALKKERLIIIFL